MYRFFTRAASTSTVALTRAWRPSWVKESTATLEILRVTASRAYVSAAAGARNPAAMRAPSITSHRNIAIIVGQRLFFLLVGPGGDGNSSSRGVQNVPLA